MLMRYRCHYYADMLILLRHVIVTLRFRYAAADVFRRRHRRHVTPLFFAAVTTLLASCFSMMLLPMLPFSPLPITPISR